MPDIDARTKPAGKRSKKDTSPRKKALANSGLGARANAAKAKRPKKKAATAAA
jgi:hypothetical protein